MKAKLEDERKKMYLECYIVESECPIKSEIFESQSALPQSVFYAL